MASLNKVILMGNLTRAPEVKFLPSGTAVCNMGLAVNQTYTKDGERKEDTTYVDITAFGRQAETCGEYLAKGDPVLLEGRLQFRQWETSDGSKRNKLEVVANNVQFLRGRADSNGPSTAPGPSAPAETAVPFQPPEDDDDIPF